MCVARPKGCEMTNGEDDEAITKLHPKVFSCCFNREPDCAGHETEILLILNMVYLIVVAETNHWDYISQLPLVRASACLYWEA